MASGARKSEGSLTYSERIKDAYRRLSEADKLRKSGKLSAAIRQFESLIEEFPDYAAALHMLGLAHMARQNYWAALSLFMRAAMLNPDDWAILGSLSQAYLSLGANEMASHTLERARAVKGDDPEIDYTIGLIYERQREYELAVDALDRSVDRKSDNPMAYYALGRCLVHLGDLKRAAAAFDRCHELNPEWLQPVSAMAQLPEGLARFDVSSALKAASADKSEDVDTIKIRTAFAKANLLHREGRYDEAWAELEKANGPPAARYEEPISNRANMRKAAVDMAKSLRPANPLPSDDPDLPVSLFILGTSRSGKTTLERILGELPGVKRGYENPIIDNTVRSTSQSAGILTINNLVGLPEFLDQRFAEAYSKDLRRRAEASKVFTNTNPGRIDEVGRLINTVPNMRFVFIKRDHADTALRIYMKHYREDSNVYAYDLQSTFAEITWYHQMIDIWQNSFSKHCLTVEYEDMVADPAAMVRRIASFCGLQAESVGIAAIGDDRGCAAGYSAHLSR